MIRPRLDIFLFCILVFLIFLVMIILWRKFLAALFKPKPPLLPLKSEDSQLLLSTSTFPEWPAPTDEFECHRRNKCLRDYVTGHNWFMSNEFHLLRTLLMQPCEVPDWEQYIIRYPLVYDIEWFCPEGRGDLICTDGQNRFLIVELKSLVNTGYGSGRTHRNSKRVKLRHGEEQTEKFAKFWHTKNPQVTNTIGVFVTEDGARLLYSSCFD